MLWRAACRSRLRLAAWLGARACEHGVTALVQRRCLNRARVMGLWREPLLERVGGPPGKGPRRFCVERMLAAGTGFFLPSSAVLVEFAWATQVTGTRIVVSIAADVFSSKPREEPESGTHLPKKRSEHRVLI